MHISAFSFPNHEKCCWRSRRGAFEANANHRPSKSRQASGQFDQLRLAPYPPNVPTQGPTSIHAVPGNLAAFVLSAPQITRCEPGKKRDFWPSRFLVIMPQQSTKPRIACNLTGIKRHLAWRRRDCNRRFPIRWCGRIVL